MKFKDKNGAVFIPTNECTEREMKASKNYTEIKEDKTNNKTAELNNK